MTTEHAPSRLSWILAIGWPVLITLFVAAVAIQNRLGGVPLLGTLLVLLAWLLSLHALALTGLDQQLATWLHPQRQRIFLLWGLLPFSYLIYALATGSFGLEPLGKVLLFTLVPVVLLYLAKPDGQVSWFDWLAVAWLWLIFDYRLLSGIWLWPENKAAYMFNALLLVNLTLVTFVCLRQIPGLRFQFRLSKEDLLQALLWFGLFCLVVIPLALAIGFVKWNPDLSWAKAIGKPLGIFFFVALPEELIFRGLIQNFLRQRLPQTWQAVLIAAVLFGATHLNNGLPELPYLLLATLAGIIYGASYLRTGNLLVAMLVHTAVDSVWFLLLWNH